MPLIRSQKEELVAKLSEELRDSRVALVFSYSGLNVKTGERLRSEAFEQGAKIRAISNNLLALILRRLNLELEIPPKNLGLAYGFTDEVAAAKILANFAKETETLEVIGGWVDGQFFSADQVKTLSALPAKEVLQAQLVGRLGGLIGSLGYCLNYPLQKFAYVVRALEENKTEMKGENE